MRVRTLCLNIEFFVKIMPLDILKRKQYARAPRPRGWVVVTKTTLRHFIPFKSLLTYIFARSLGDFASQFYLNSFRWRGRVPPQTFIAGA